MRRTSALLMSIAIGVLLFTTAGPTEAQRRRADHPNMFVFSYSMATTVGSSRDFIGDYSWSGAVFEYRYRFSRQLSFGALVQWNRFSDKSTSTSTRENVTYTGTLLRYSDAVLVGLSSHYYVNTGHSKARPFFGIDIGGTWTDRLVDAAWWSEDPDGWHFGLAPELGVELKIDPEFSVLVSSKFNWAVETDNMPEELFFNFNLGASFNI